jgi:hypothetical protein
MGACSLYIRNDYCCLWIGDAKPGIFHVSVLDFREKLRFIKEFRIYTPCCLPMDLKLTDMEPGVYTIEIYHNTNLLFREIITKI